MWRQKCHHGVPSTARTLIPECQPPHGGRVGEVETPCLVCHVGTWHRGGILPRLSSGTQTTAAGASGQSCERHFVFCMWGHFVGHFVFCLLLPLQSSQPRHWGVGGSPHRPDCVSWYFLQSHMRAHMNALCRDEAYISGSINLIRHLGRSHDPRNQTRSL